MRFRESDPPTMLVFAILYSAVMLIVIGGLIAAHCDRQTPAGLVFIVIYCMFVGIFIVACIAAFIAARCHKLSLKEGADVCQIDTQGRCAIRFGK